ncbi:MAG: undecaprenyl-diphosphate phosphatase [Actinomycetota bacterium]
MPILHAVVLGLVQGLSEFLPISSSGHLLLVPWLFEWNDFEGENGESLKKFFDVALHLGTFVAVLAYFWRDVVTYVVEGTLLVVNRTRPTTTDGKLAWFFVLSTIPAALIGAFFEDQIDEQLGTPTIIAISLILFGILLWWADRMVGQRELEQFGARDAVLVGAAQALALNPGTSRSGITMTGARFLKFDRDAAARISFVMSLPVILGALVFKTYSATTDPAGVPSDLWVPMAVGVVTAGISGWFAVWGTLRLIRTRSFTPFVIYRIAAGIFVLTLIATGVRPG